MKRRGRLTLGPFFLCGVFFSLMVAISPALRADESPDPLFGIEWLRARVSAQVDGQSLSDPQLARIRESVVGFLARCPVPLVTDEQAQAMTTEGATLLVDVQGATAGNADAIAVNTSLLILRPVMTRSTNPESFAAVVWIREYIDCLPSAGSLDAVVGRLDSLIDEFATALTGARGGESVDEDAINRAADSLWRSLQDQVGTPQHAPNAAPTGGVCSNCGGAGEYRCRGCAGSGSAHGPGAPPPPATPPCRLCYGSGVQRCPVCQGGVRR